MSILLANDDGIHAPGLAHLYHALRDLAEVHVVAPDAERSAVGHAITLTEPIKSYPVETDTGLKGHAVSGTPADCVKLAVCALLDERPELVVSGINLGPNAGISVIYSGTVSAATEGVILGIPSIAISLDTFKAPCWDAAAAVARRIVKNVMANQLPPHTLLNVNIPNRPESELVGTRITRMGLSRFVEVFDKRQDPRGNTYYWMDGEMELIDKDNNTDIQALEQGYVSLTPIHFDLTNYEALDAVRWSFRSMLER